MSDGKDYEIFVQKLQQALLYSEPLTKQKNIKIERNKKITDSSGIEREFDLYWEYELDGITYKTIIECKDYASKISIDRIDALIGKICDIPIPDLKLVFATKTGYQEGAKIKAKHHRIDLLIVREQRDDDWEDEEGNPLIREIEIRMRVKSSTCIKKFSPHLDKDWKTKNTDMNLEDSFHISGMPNEIFIEDIKKNETYSLYDLTSRLDSISGDEYGELHYNESFENAYLINNDLRLKIKSYEVTYIRFEPLIIPIKISEELIGVIEYLDTGLSTAIFSDKIVRKIKASDRIVIAQEKEGRQEPREPSHIASHSSHGIDKTPGVCGGDACIRHTRIPVWALVQLRQLGTDEADLLRTYPTLTAEDLVNAWSYYQSHTAEIEQQIADNESA